MSDEPPFETPEPDHHRPDSDQKKICFVDMETSGLYPNKHAVIQIACIVEINGKVVEEFNSLVTPHDSAEVDDKSLEINKITREMLEDAPTPAEVKLELETLFEKYVNKYDKKDKMFFAAYNSGFDWQFFRKFWLNQGDKYFGSWFWTTPIDIMTIATIRLLKERKDMDNMKLQSVLDMFGLVSDGEAHDALIDIQMARAVYYHCLTDLSAGNK